VRCRTVVLGPQVHNDSMVASGRTAETVECIADDLYAEHLVQVDNGMVQRIDLPELTFRNNRKVIGPCIRTLIKNH
jgi:hypothetical protein